MDVLEVHDPVVDRGVRLFARADLVTARAVTHVDVPGELELADIRRLDLRQGREAVVLEVALNLDPVGARVGRQLRRGEGRGQGDRRLGLGVRPIRSRAPGENEESC